MRKPFPKAVAKALNGFAVAFWIYISYFAIGLWSYFAFGMVFQKLEWTKPGMANLTPLALLLFHFMAFAALLLNTLGIALYWKAFRTTLSEIVTALRLPPNHSIWIRFPWIHSLAAYRPFTRQLSSEILSTSCNHKHELHYQNIAILLLVVAWLYFTYTTIGIWLGLNIGLLLHKLDWLYIGFKEIDLRTFIFIHLLSIATVAANRFALPRYWQACLTTFAMLIALISLPFVVLHGFYRLKPFRITYRLGVTRLLRAGWLRPVNLVKT